ncbi:uncharacterized protein LOC131682108 [Topomyia yanbarensis]|uniref:uncharacterized protein LOC131682108 n=1 Tax=Topomyia yanbarensis TaxID=2498891 RepID=UPI00273B4E2F|nr:uncharacterized protein LOC131682108 [Topomyia yanbarensis]
MIRLLVLLVSVQAWSLESLHRTNRSTGDAVLSAQLFQIIEFYKQPDPVGLPIGPTLDPMPIPPIKHSVALSTMHMRDVQTHGLSKLRIRLFQVELSRMNIRTEVIMEELLINGSYTLSSLLQSSSGPFNVYLTNVVTAANVSLIVNPEGTLRTQDIQLDFGFAAMASDFQNLGFMGRMFQRLVNAAPSMVLDMIKPFMLREAHVKIQKEIDSKFEELIEKREVVLVNSISPLDLLIAEVRMMLQRKRYDPYMLPDYKIGVGIFGVQLSHSLIRGLSNFYRFGDVGITIRNNTADLEVQVGTGRLEGFTQWQTTPFSKYGSIHFTVEYLRVTIQTRQHLDLRRKPSLLDLQLEMGNIQIRCSGAGSLDYLVEAAINILPNLLRYQIMDAIEGPLKARIREKLECMNMEQFVKRHVLEFENRGAGMEVDWRLCERRIPSV